MLGKLIKYELKAGARFFIPIYSVMLVLAATIGFTSDYLFLNEGTSMIFGILTMLFGFVVIAAIVLTVYLLVNRFYKNLLGDEGYLMFSLPASTAEHICAKAITTFIWMVLGCVMLVLSGLIMATLSIDWSNFRYMIETLSQVIKQFHFDGDLAVYILEVAVFITLFTVSFIVKIYASISVGHFWSGHKTLGAVLSFICFLIIEMFLNAAIADMNISINIWMLYAYALVGIVIYGFITWYILDRHLNLE